ncbi:MAG: T9SS type A sorting domain-containing protein [Flavobacteriales bacterium]
MKHHITFLFAMLIAALSGLAQDTCTVNPIPIPDATDSWQWVSGSYAPGGSITYELPLLQSNAITYEFKTGCGNGATADHNTAIEYRTPPPCILVNTGMGNCSEGGANLNISFVVWEGPSRIRVRGANGEGGSFTMAYRSVGGEPGGCNECPSYDETLAPGSYWQTVDGTYGTTGCKVYKVSVTAGLIYEFKTGCGDGATADHDTRIGLSGYNCIEVSQDDNGCESGRSSIVWTAPWSGTAFVRVGGAAAEAGSFSLAYRRSGGNGSACGSCTDYNATLSSGWNWGLVTGSYLPGGCQVYRLAQEEGYEYIYKTGCGDGADADHPAQLELFDAACGLLQTGTDNCGDGSSTIAFTSTGQWPLYLRVSGTGGSGGTYSLATKRQGPCPVCPAHDMEITPTGQWQTSDSSFLENGCRIYQLNVTAGTTTFLQLECTNCDGWGAPYLTMMAFDTACSPLSDLPSFPEWQTTELSFLAEYTGPVYVRVYSTNWHAGEFTLSYKQVGAATDACTDAPIVPIPYFGSVELEGDLTGIAANDAQLSGTPWEGSAVAWYALEVPDCYNLLVSYCEQDPVWPNTMGILATTCTGDSIIHGISSVYFPCSNGNASYEFNLTPGTYYLPILSDPSNPGDGAYHISVGCSDVIVDGISTSAEYLTWAVHPNPGRDELVLTGFVPGNGPADAWVMDMTGRVVQRLPITSSSTRIDASRWGRGAYIIRIMDSNDPVVLRWIKE